MLLDLFFWWIGAELPLAAPTFSFQTPVWGRSFRTTAWDRSLVTPEWSRSFLGES